VSQAPDDDDPRPQAGKLPTGRIARTMRVGGLVAGQGLRWAGTRTANRARSPERAAEATNERTAALVNQLVEQLGQMRGAAMKVGQMISMVEFDGLPEDQRDELQRRLAALRDDVPPVKFADIEKLLRRELGEPVGKVFASFDEHAFAAASIGQVHRATTRDGDEVVVKVQYPGVAEAVETDLRNATLLLPLVKRLAPGLDAKALANEMRERIGEELDYELEAQSQRRIERLMRGHPFAHVPHVYTDLSTRRVLVSEYVEGERFEEVRRADEAVRDRYAEIVFRFFLGLLYRNRIALGDPHPGNYLLMPDGRVGFLDYGLLRDLSVERVDRERAIAAAVLERSAEGLKSAMSAAGYLPPGARADAVDAEWALRMMTMAIGWYTIPGYRRLSPDFEHERERELEDELEGDGGRVVDELHGSAADVGGADGDGRGARGRPRPTREERAALRRQVNQFTLPPEAVLIRRMHGLVAIVVAQLRAGADWGAIAAEYLRDAPPSTELGEQEAAFFARRGRGRGGTGGRVTPVG
jgi:predicted unusual protein kinase regulating ubiquinone biosynthesis (AarF/ABC1/UbiB family)